MGTFHDKRSPGSYSLNLSSWLLKCTILTIHRRRGRDPANKLRVGGRVCLEYKELQRNLLFNRFPVRIYYVNYVEMTQ